jgi:hypothetical protein
MKIHCSITPLSASRVSPPKYGVGGNTLCQISSMINITALLLLLLILRRLSFIQSKPWSKLSAASTSIHRGIPSEAARKSEEIDYPHRPPAKARKGEYPANCLRASIHIQRGEDRAGKT